MKIFLMRHGQTTGDLEDRYGGAYDDHLTEEGKRQSTGLAQKRLRVKYNGSTEFNGGPIYVAEDFVQTVVPNNQQQNFQTILANEQPAKFVSDSLFPSTLITAIAENESAGTLNNEIISGDSSFGGIFQVHPSKSGHNRNCNIDPTKHVPLCDESADATGTYWSNVSLSVPITDIFATPITSENSNMYLDKIYTHTLYSNDPQGITNNIDDGLSVLKDKYTSVASAVAHGTISQQDLRDIETVAAYNGGPRTLSTKAVYFSLDTTLNYSGVRAEMDRDYPNLTASIQKNINDGWIAAVRNACPSTTFTQTSGNLGTCLNNTDNTKNPNGGSYY